MNQGIYELDHSQGVEVVASLFKSFFRELAEPLLPLSAYSKCLRAASDIVALNDIISNLPMLNRRVLAFLITFLQQFAQPEACEISKMNSANLAMVRASQAGVRE
jgi:hypothetical protein